MKENLLTEKMERGKTALNAFLTIPSAWTAEVMARVGYDALTIDMQHSPAEFSDVMAMLQAISVTPTVPLIRLPWNDPAICMKVLDAGAQGVICPTINDRRDVEQFVGACRYPPQGYRSYGAFRASMQLGADYFRESGKYILAFAMIETAAAVDNLEEMASVDGLSGLFVGPYDLSVSLGLSEDKIADVRGEELQEVLKRVLTVCRKRNLYSAVFTGDREDAAFLAGMGFQLVSYGDDTSFMLRAAGEDLRFLKRGLGG